MGLVPLGHLSSAQLCGVQREHTQRAASKGFLVVAGDVGVLGECDPAARADVLDPVIVVDELALAVGVDVGHHMDYVTLRLQHRCDGLLAKTSVEKELDALTRLRRRRDRPH